MDVPVSDTLVRAARELLRWSQPVLAKKAGIGVATLRRFETGDETVRPEKIAAIVDALQEAGVAFLGPRSPRLRVEEGVALTAFAKQLPRPTTRAYPPRLKTRPSLDSKRGKSLMTKALKQPESLTVDERRELATAAKEHLETLKQP